MKPEEIAALAREYAEEECNKSTLPDKTQLHEDKLVEFYDVYSFLLRRFYLVEKSKVVKLCRLTFEHDDSIDYGLIDGLTDLVLELFPEQYHRVADNTEIAKEVEE